MTKKFTALITLFAMLIAAALGGCNTPEMDVSPSTSSLPQASPSGTTPITEPLAEDLPNDPGTTDPTGDVANINSLVSHMQFSTILTKDLSIESQYEAAVSLTVTEYIDESISLELVFGSDKGNHPNNLLQLQHEELGLPYYCAKAHIYFPEINGYAPYDVAVDIDMGYMILKASTNIMSCYVVASVDPTIDPLQIAEHFSIFFEIYDHTHIDTGIRTKLYFDLFGTWITDTGEIMGTMPFYITGKLPESYEDGSTMEIELNFIWPDSFGYRNEGAMTCTVTVNVFEEHHGHPNFHGTGTLYDVETNEQVPFAYNIFPMDSTVIIYVNGQYLIGISREMSQMDSMLNYYKAFIFTELE